MSADGGRVAGSLAESDTSFALLLLRTGEPDLDTQHVAFEIGIASALPVELLAADGHELRERFNADAGAVRFVAHLTDVPQGRPCGAGTRARRDP